MRYFYQAPPPGLQGLVGCFYLMDMPEAAGGLVRVEIPHIRFLCRGHSDLSVGDAPERFAAPDVVVCGPSFRTGSAAVSDNCVIIGASLTPLGWQRFIGTSVAPMANRKVRMSGLRADAPIDPLLDILADGDDAARFAAVHGFLAAILLPDTGIRTDFIDTAMAWAEDPASPPISDLIAATGLSARQVDRLCRHYFGGSPKQLHRVFRALNIAHALAIGETDDWRDVIDGHYDQSHLIRDFRDRIGCTPRAFMADRRMMMRHDIQLRLAVEGLRRYCLIG